MILLQIDYRESALITQVQLLLTVFPSYANAFTMETKNLPIGDIWLSEATKSEATKSEATSGTPLVIVERKTIADLLSSIKDGRYDEQAYRLHASAVHNHNILYLVEGDATHFKAFKDAAQKKLFYSALTSIQLYKGFSVQRTQNVEETALLLCQMAAKIDKCGLEKKAFFYKNVGQEGITGDEDDGNVGLATESYSQVVKAVKKDNITPENIGAIMLNVIPGISHVSSAEIMAQYKTLKNLIACLEANPACLDTFTVVGKNGKSRKLSKTVIANIRRFLVGQGASKSGEIKY
jgi:crossover junction endonuclease MUS81